MAHPFAPFAKGWGFDDDSPSRMRTAMGAPFLAGFARSGAGIDCALTKSPHSSQNRAWGKERYAEWPGLLIRLARQRKTAGAPLLRSLQGRVRCCKPQEILILSHSAAKRNLSPAHIHLHGARFGQQIVSITTPTPLLGRLHQSPFHRIAMDIPQFLHAFLGAPDIEIIRPPARKPAALLRRTAYVDVKFFVLFSATSQTRCAVSALASRSTDYPPVARSSRGERAPASQRIRRLRNESAVVSARESRGSNREPARNRTEADAGNKRW